MRAAATALMRAATVVQVLQDLFQVLLHVLFYLWSLLEEQSAKERRVTPTRKGGQNNEETVRYLYEHSGQTTGQLGPLGIQPTESTRGSSYSHHLRMCVCRSQGRSQHEVRPDNYLVLICFFAMSTLCKYCLVPKSSNVYLVCWKVKLISLLINNIILVLVL